MAGEDEDYGSARITITLDDSGVVGEARDLGLRIQRALNRATRGLGRQIRRNIQDSLDATSVSVLVTPDLTEFRRRIEHASFWATNGAELSVPVAPDLTGFVERIRTLLAGAEVEIRVVPDFDDFDARIQTHRAPDVTVDVNADVDSDRFARALSGLGSIAGRVGSVVLGALKFGAIGTAAAASIPSVLGLAASLASVAGAAAAVPAAIGGLVVANVALRLALNGVGDAFNAALTEDAEKFEKALEGLSPVAQEVAREVRALRPEFDDLKSTVQDRFFEPLVGQVSGLAKALGGPLKSALSAISGQFGTAAGQVAEFLRSADGVAAVKQTLTGTTAATKGLAAAINPVAQGFTRLAGEISAAFGAKLGSTIEGVGKKVGAFLTNAATSGKALTWVSDAVGVLKTLGGVLRNVGSILRSVLSAAEQTGGGLLNTLRDLTGQAAAFLKKAAGKTALQGMLSGLAGVGAQLGPIFEALVTQVGSLVPTLLPVIKSLGKAVSTLLEGLDLRAVAEGLRPVADGLLEAIRLIAPQLKPVAEALGGLLAAVSPLLPVIGRLVALVGKELAFTVKALTPVVKLLTEWLAAALTPVIELAEGGFRILSGAARVAWSVLGPFVKLVGGTLVTAFRKLSESGIITKVFDKLASALRTLKPFFDEVAPAAAKLARDLKQLGQDVLAQLLPALGRLKKEIAPALAPLKELGADVMQKVGRGAAFAGKSFARLLTKVAPLARELLGTVKPVAKLTLSFVKMHVLDGLPEKMERLVAGLRLLGGALADVIGDVLSFVGRVIDAFQTLYDVLVGHSIIPDLINAIIEWFAQLPGQVLGVISGFVSSAVSWFAQLPGRITASLSQLGVLLQTSISAGLTSVTVTLQTWGAGAVAWFTSLPSRIWAAMSSLGGLLAGLFFSALSSASAAASSGLSLITSVFGGLPARIWTALSALPGRLASLFQSAGMAALTVARSIGSRVVAFFAGLPGSILGAIRSLVSTVPGVFRSAKAAAIGVVQSMISSVVGVFRGLPGKVQAALSGAGTLLATAGRQMIQGMISGVRGMAGQLASAAKSVVGSAVSAAKSALGIHSPSRVFAAIGRDTGKGFIVGLTGTAAQIKSTTEKISRDITNAFKGKNTKLDDKLVKLVADGNKQLQVLAKQRDAIAQRIADARKFATETAAAALQAFSLQNLTQNGVTKFNVVEGLDQAVAQVKNFTKQINALAKRGLRKDLLQQIIGLGPQQGAELATFFSSQSASSLKQINDLQAQLVKATNQLGKDASDDLFDAGKQASKGFLAGLKGQEKDIEDLMVKIAKSMQKAIRKALGIHSPSRVFAKIGQQTGQGLEVGFLGHITRLATSTRTAARAVTDAVTSQFAALPTQMTGPVLRPSAAVLGPGVSDVVVPLTRGRGARPTAQERGLAELLGNVRGTRRADAAAQPSVTNNFTVQAAQDPEQTARIVMRRLAQARLV